MKLLTLTAKNFRTLAGFNVGLDLYYNAVSGVNNCGKSNFIDAIRLLIDRDEYEYHPPVTLDFESDFTTWKKPKGSAEYTESIEVSGTFSIDKSTDVGLLGFLSRYLKLEEDELSIFTLTVSISHKDQIESCVVKVNDRVFGSDVSAEVRKRLRNGQSLVFHNSTTDGSRGRHYYGQLSELSDAANEIIQQARAEIARKLKKAAAPQQQQLQALFSRTTDNITVSIEAPKRFGDMPYSITLSDSGAAVPLRSWGSGTQNKTMILLALLRASQANQAINTTDRLTPILMIEEPESFLHPLAQSEFGTALIKLAEELNVQVIVSTHSVALLNTERPSANLLFERIKKYNKPLETNQLLVGDANWMAPFASLLGYNAKSFEPWQQALSLRGNRIVLVEGAIDQAYLESMKNDVHGAAKIPDDVHIFSYNGIDNILNESILKLVIELSSKCIVVCDKDVLDKAKRVFDLLGLEEDKGYVSVGKADGAGNIEDLLPTKFRNKVYSSSPELVAKLMGPAKDAKSAKSAMKKKLCEHFLASRPSSEEFKDFRQLTRRINRALVS